MTSFPYQSFKRMREQPGALSDIFAFGAVLYELLTGTRVFHGDTAADVMTFERPQPRLRPQPRPARRPSSELHP